jgi:hypothetical protein
VNAYIFLFHSQNPLRSVGKCAILAFNFIQQEVLRRTNRLISFDTTRTAQKTNLWGGGAHSQGDLVSLITKN